jgi:hypothetical protein
MQIFLREGTIEICFLNIGTVKGQRLITHVSKDIRNSPMEFLSDFGILTPASCWFRTGYKHLSRSNRTIDRDLSPRTINGRSYLIR